MGCVGFVEKIEEKLITQCQLGCGDRVLKTRDKDDPPVAEVKNKDNTERVTGLWKSRDLRLG